MTKEEEKEKLDYVRKHDSFTSPSIEDVDFYDDNLFFWDCCNIDYCKSHRKAEMTFSCLRGAKGSRCTIEEKESIRSEAAKKGFTFPNS